MVLILVLIFVHVLATNDEEYANLKKLCFFNLNNVNIDEFFESTDYSELSIPEYDIIIDECDFSDPNTVVKWVTKGNREQSQRIIDKFEITELKYISEFYNVFDSGDEISVEKFWNFFFNAWFDPLKYFKLALSKKRKSLNSTEYEMVRYNNTNETVPKREKTINDVSIYDLPGYILSKITPGNYTKNRKVIVDMGDDVPKSIISQLSSNAAHIRKYGGFGNKTNRNKTRKPYNSSAPAAYTFLDRHVKKVKGWFGIYDKDMYGRRGIDHRDIVHAIYDQLINNDTFTTGLESRYSKLFSEFADEVYYKNSFVNLISNIYKRVTEHERFEKIKNNLYSNIIHGTPKSNWVKKLKLFYNNPQVRSLKLVDHVNKVNNNIMRVDSYLNILGYIYSNPDYNSDYIRNDSPIQFIKSLIRHNEMRKYGEEEEEEIGVYRNLPAYGDTNTTRISHPGDLFDLNYWNPDAAHWSGYAPDDKRRIRADGWLIIGFVPADVFAFLRWNWRYTLRSNLTMTYFPFLKDSYEPPNPFICLPRPLYLPDPRFGCRPPVFDYYPAMYPPGELDFFFDLGLCAPWRLPWDQFEALLQLVFTPLFGPIAYENPDVQDCFDTIEDITGLKLINNATGGQGSDALPMGLWQCMLPKSYLLILVVVFLFIIGVLIGKTCIVNAFNVAKESGSGVGSCCQDIKALRQECDRLNNLVQALNYSLLKHFQTVGK